LSIRVEDPASGKISAAAIPFVVENGDQHPQPIVIARGQSESPQQQAAVHYERALCLLSQDRPKEAVDNLQQSWQLSKNSTVKALLDHLSANRAPAVRSNSVAPVPK
jgi:hypothetical protein